MFIKYPIHVHCVVTESIEIYISTSNINGY